MPSDPCSFPAVLASHKHGLFFVLETDVKTIAEDDLHELPDDLESAEAACQWAAERARRPPYSDLLEWAIGREDEFADDRDDVGAGLWEDGVYP